MIDIPDNILPVNNEGNQVCPKCKAILADCACPGYDPAAPKMDQFHPRVRLDKKGRKGKTVTMIEGLPAEEKYLRELAKKIKSKAGSGGTHYILESNGVIELQGDHRSMVNVMLKNL